jgi:serine/threonine protein kinase
MNNEMIVGNKYKVIEKIGSGSFGEIWKAENVRTKEIVAIKIEPHTNKTKLLKNETKIYQYIGKCKGFPEAKWYGVDEKNNYMVMTLLGNTLTHLINKNINLSLKMTLFITKQIVQILKIIHNKGLIHRDIKPDNFLFGLDENRNHLHLIDFGFCKKYTDHHGQHIPQTAGKTPLGTPNYISINVHDGIEPSRRDDLESVGYIMLYMLYGKLEWNEICEYYNDYKNVNNKIKIQKIKIVEKEEIPRQICEYLLYCRSLGYDETPNYDYISTILDIRN